MAVPLTAINDQLKETSSRLSEIARTISISILALVWLFALGGEDSPAFPNAPNPVLIVMTGGLAFLCLMFDYCQYLFGYINTRQVLKAAEESNSQKAEYDYTAFFYRAREFSFLAKQFALIFSILFLSTTIFLSLYGGHT